MAISLGIYPIFRQTHSYIPHWSSLAAELPRSLKVSVPGAAEDTSRRPICACEFHQWNDGENKGNLGAWLVVSTILILVNGKDYSKSYRKKMFETTNQGHSYAFFRIRTFLWLHPCPLWNKPLYCNDFKIMSYYFKPRVPPRSKLSLATNEKTCWKRCENKSHGHTWARPTPEKHITT